MFSETYGNAVVRALTVSSRPFLFEPPHGFANHPLTAPRGVVLLARQEQVARLKAWVDGARAIVPSVALVDAADVRRRVPILKKGYVAAAALDLGARDMDVHALHDGFLRGSRARGATVATGVCLVALRREGAGWLVRTTEGDWLAEHVVNAAGAWADAVALMAGAAPCGLVHMRRTALTVDLPAGMDAATWPAVIDVDEEFYFKPEGGRLLLSPAEETPMAPCDVQPDELDIAVCIDRVQSAADLPVRRVARSWAGLRSFAADRTPVIGFDPCLPGFFWLAGQGGYGIQIAPAMGRVAAALLAGRDVPADVAALGVTPGALTPGRPALRAAGSRAA